MALKKEEKKEKKEEEKERKKEVPRNQGAMPRTAFPRPNIHIDQKEGKEKQGRRNQQAPSLIAPIHRPPRLTSDILQNSKAKSTADSCI